MEKIKQGDIVKIVYKGANASAHVWYNYENVIRNTGDSYLVQDVDYNSNYGSGYVIKINDTAYGSVAVKVIQSSFDNELEAVRKVIYKD